MKKKSLFWIIIVIIFTSNFYSGYINLLTERSIGKRYHFETESGNFQFVSIPSKGRDLEMMERQYQSFLEQNPSFSKETIYRTFRINPLKFWNWYNYLFIYRYQYEFKESDKINNH